LDNLDGNFLLGSDVLTKLDLTMLSSAELLENLVLIDDLVASD
jgi:hypothetical protein